MVQESICQKPGIERANPDLFQTTDLLQILEKSKQGLLRFQIPAVKTEVNAGQNDLMKTLGHIDSDLFDNLSSGDALAWTPHAWHYAETASIITPILDLHQRS
jgi:hypothetical protein